MTRRATDDEGIRFFDALVRYETDLWNAVDRELLAAGLPGIGYVQALRVVAIHAGFGRVHELREGLRVTGGAASKLTDRLEASGLVTRTANPDDRRSSFIVLTDEGARSLELAVAVVTAVLTRYLADAAVDTRRLTDALTDLRAVLHPPETGIR
jgi:MarR family multiple antibiotic resistance transcriptional regulator